MSVSIFKLPDSDPDGPETVVVMAPSWISKDGPRMFPTPRTDEEIRLLAGCLTLSEAERVLRERKRMAADLQRGIRKSPALMALIAEKFPNAPKYSKLGRRRRASDPARQLLRGLSAALSDQPAFFDPKRSKTRLREFSAEIALVASSLKLSASDTKIAAALEAGLSTKQATPNSVAVAIVKTMDRRSVSALRKLATLTGN